MLALTIAGATEHLPEDETARNQAMLRYWDAKQAGDPTARLVRIEDIALVAPLAANTSPTDDDDDDPTPAAPGAVSPIAEDRIGLHETWLTEAGFALEPPLYAPGIRVLPLGDRNFRLERRRVEQLSRFAHAASAVSRVIAAEHRRDRTIPVRDIAMTEHGTLTLGAEEVGLELGAFYQLASHCGFGMGARYLAERCDAQLRAENVNRQLRRCADKELTLRLRENDSGTVGAYATVTPTYTAVDTDTVLGRATEQLQDSRVEILYDGNGVRATALWMPDQVVDLAAGDVFKVGVRLETDDLGRGRIRVSAVAFRNRCLNLLIIGQGTVETASAIHKGAADRILQVVTDGIAQARGKVGNFLDAWGHARTVQVDPQETLRRWVEEKKLVVQGERDRDATVAALLAAWQQEPGGTLADAVNAVTRAAHEHPSWNLWTREDLERQAARLVLIPA